MCLSRLLGVGTSHGYQVLESVSVVLEGQMVVSRSPGYSGQKYPVVEPFGGGLSGEGEYPPTSLFPNGGFERGWGSRVFGPITFLNHVGRRAIPAWRASSQVG